MKKNSVVLFSDAQEELNKHSRHSYKIFRNLSLSNLDLTKSLLNNCCLSECNFTNCNLDSSDIEGCEFTACVFTSVSFNVADISSTSFQNCIFSDCKFFSANLLDNGFIRCTFSMCLIEGATINTNLFEHSCFTRLCPEDSALYSNEFAHCVFKESRLLTSIYYTIFYKCSFFACEIDSYIFGFQFGLRQNQLKRMSIQHFGTSRVELSFAIDALHDIYSDRKLKLEDLTLNFIKNEAMGTTMVALIHDFIAMIHAGYIIKVDEIKFLRRIINFAYQKNLIPQYFFVLMAKDIFSIKSVRAKKGNIADNALNELMILYHTVYSINVEIAQNYKDLVAFLLANKECLPTLSVELIYKKRPEYRLSSLLQDAYAIELYPIYERSGSFIECFQFVANHLNEIAAVVTILGFGIDMIKTIRRLFHKKAKKAENASTAAPMAFEQVIEEETFTEIYEVSTEIDSLSQTSLRGNGDWAKEKYYNHMIRTVVQKRTIFIRYYDTDNIKKMNFK